MSLRILTADERLREAQGKTTMAIFGPSGGGKTTLLTTMPEEQTVCLDFEAGLKSVQGWKGDSISIRRFAEGRREPDPAAGQGHRSGRCRTPFGCRDG